MTGILAGTIDEVSVDSSGHVTATMKEQVRVDSLASALRTAGHYCMAQLAETDN